MNEYCYQQYILSKTKHQNSKSWELATFKCIKIGASKKYFNML